MNWIEKAFRTVIISIVQQDTDHEVKKLINNILIAVQEYIEKKHQDHLLEAREKIWEQLEDIDYDTREETVHIVKLLWEEEFNEIFNKALWIEE